jgi:hypothetical protein
VPQAERLHAQIRPQFEQVFAPGFLPLGILRPTCRVEPQLPSNPLQQGHRHRSVGQQALTGKRSKHNCTATPRRLASPRRWRISDRSDSLNV